MQAFITSIAYKTSFASKTERERLRLSGCRRVLRLSRVVFEGGWPHSYQHVVLPLQRLPGLDSQFASTATLQEIATRHGLTLGRATEHVRFVDAPPDAITHLAINGERKVLRLDRVTATVDGAPIEWCVAYLSPEQPRTV
jgi:DNA-binding GntR family transcriptional regulator